MSSHLTLTSFLVSTLAALTLSSPLPGNDLSPAIGIIEARDEFQPTSATFTCLYLTNESNWSGEGINLCEVGGTCGSKLPDGLAKNVSSAGPEEGVTCFLFSEQGCTGDRSAPLVNPGYGDLKAIGFNKKAQSWRCWKWCGWMGPSSSSSASSTAAAASSGLSASIVGARSPRLVSITTTIDLSEQAATTAPGLPSVSISSSKSASDATASSSQATTASDAISASPLTAAFETSLTTIVVTHTYADGSITVISSPLAIPVPVGSGPDNAGGAVSMSTTMGQTLQASAPFTTSQRGVRITTTLGDSSFSSPGVATAVATTPGAAVAPIPTETSEGVTVALSSVSPSSPVSSTQDASVEVSPSSWASLVTLTGVDATLTVTLTGQSTASPTSVSTRAR